MKKIFSWIFGVMFCLSALLISFLPAKNLTKNQAVASSSIEQKYYDASTIELVSKTPATLTGAVADKTPFDSETKQRMDGISITPVADEYGQVKSFSYNLAGGLGYTPEVNDVIYVWVYLIDAITFQLEISIGNNSSTSLAWKFNSQDLYEMGSGWKLISLKLSDHYAEVIDSQKNYTFITFKYFSESSESDGEDGYQDYEIKTDERFSFYHVFVSKNANLIKKSGKIYNVSRSFYKFAADFDIEGNVFVGDKLKVETPSKMFEYLVVGKNDLADYTSSGKYFWNLILKDPNSTSMTIDFGDTIKFYEKGFYQFTIQLIEEKTLEDDLILNIGLNIYSDEQTLGKFDRGSNFKIKNDEKIVVELNISDTLIERGELQVSLSNNNAEIESYYEEDGVLYVCIVGKANGRVDLEMSAEAMSKFGDEKQTFTSVATINVEYTKGEVDIFIVVLWIAFIIFSLGIIIYLSISVVKSRKNDVR